MTVSVLHLITGLGTGGAEGLLVRLAVGLQAQGIPQHVVSLGNDRDSYAEVLQAHDIGVTALGVNSVASAPGGLIKLVGIIHRFSPRVIQGWMYHGNIFALIAHKLALPTGRRAVFWNLRASNMDAKRYGQIVRWSARLSRWPDVIIANSESGAAFHKSCGFKARRMVIIDNGIDSETFRPDMAARREVRQELGVPLDVPVIIHPARVDPMKDHESFLKAIAKVPAVTALMVGSRTNRLEASKNVKALGLRRDMARLYAAADIVVSSSAFGEGFSNAIAEGMSTGLVPIVTDVGDARRIVADTGRVVPPSDPCALAAAIAQECASSDNGEAKGLRARARIVDNFSVVKFVEAFVRLYQSA